MNEKKYNPKKIHIRRIIAAILIGLFAMQLIWKHGNQDQFTDFIMFLVCVCLGIYLVYHITRAFSINTRRWIFIIFVFTVLFFCIYGSWKYYSQKNLFQGKPLRFDIAILQSVINLMFANSKIEIADDTPVFYELARLLAPMLTTFCLYFLAEEAVLRLIGIMRFSLSLKRQILIFGYYESSKALIDDLITEGISEKKNVVLICDHKIDNKLRLYLEQKGIILIETDYKQEEDDPDDIKVVSLNILNLNNADEICLLEDEETNLLLFNTLININSIRNRDVHFSVKTESDAISDALVRIYNTKIKSNKTHPSLYVFQAGDLMAYDLINSKPFLDPTLDHYTNATDKIFDLKKIDTPHILIAGINDCCFSILKYIMRTGLISIDPGSKTMVTLIDNTDKEKMTDWIYSYFPMIGKVIDLHIVSCDVNNADFIAVLDQQLARPITYAISCFPSTKQNIVFSNGITNYLSYLKNHHHKHFDGCVPVALRINENKEYNSVLREVYGNKGTSDYEFVYFGSDDKLFSYRNLFRNQTEDEAKEYHKEYSLISEDDRTWETLTYEERESNYSCVLSKNSFKKMIDLLWVDTVKLDETIKNSIKEGSTTSQYMDDIKEKTPQVIDLAELEHLRWMGFHYSLGYISSSNDFDKHEYVLSEVNKRIRFGRNQANLIPFNELWKKNIDTIRFDIQNIILYNK